MKPEHEVQRLARRQKGLVSRVQVHQIGMTDRQIAARVGGGHWRRVHLGVYQLGQAELDWESRLMAAALAGMPAAVISHRSAARLWELDGVVSSMVELTTPHWRAVAAEGAVTHRSRTLRAEDIVRLAAMPVTRVERTLVDLGRYVGPKALELALESALRRNRISEAGLQDYLQSLSGPIPGLRHLRSVLQVRSPGRPTGSVPEVELEQALREAGLPLGVRQFPINLAGEEVVVVDRAWPLLKVACEVDGFEFHGGRAAHSFDLQRQNKIVGAGWLLLRYSRDRIRGQIAAVVREIENVLASREHDLKQVG